MNVPIDEVLRVKDLLLRARLDEQLTALAVRRARDAHKKAKANLRALEQQHHGVSQLALFDAGSSCDVRAPSQ